MSAEIQKLVPEINKLNKEGFELRMSNRRGVLKDTSQIKKNRKAIARIKTKLSALRLNEQQRSNNNDLYIREKFKNTNWYCCFS